MLLFGTAGSPRGTPRSGTEAAVAYIRELELDALEIAWVQSVRVSDKTCEQISAAAGQHNVALSVHAPYYINLNSQTAELMAKSDERLLAAVRKGHLAGATDIVFHPGSYHGQPAEQVYERVAEKLRESTGILAEEDVTVTLRPETTGKSAMFGTLEELVHLAKEIPGVAPCVDVAHLHARTGAFNTYDEFAEMFRLVERELGREGLHAMHFHLSGIEYGPKGERQHLIVDEADLDWRAFLQACVAFDVQGRVICESPNLEEDALSFQRVYREFRART
jgi:deoxyribonuclease-4